MSQNPIIQYIFMFIGILCLVKLLAMSTLLISLALIFSGLFALTIWIISQDKKTTDTIRKYPIGEHWINFVQNISKVTPETSGPEIPGIIDENNQRGIKIHMIEPEHFQEGKMWFKEHFKGHEEDIQKLFSKLETSVEIYSRSVEKGHRLRKPIASYLILGPTGTGKTYCSKLISQLLYPEKGFLQLPMNTLKLEQDVNVLFGEPSGNNNNDKGGILTRPVLKNPYQIVLFDEIEKCHPAIHDSLYQILDEGRSIEKSSGREVDFTNCAFIATGNISETVQRKLNAEKRKNLTPELWKKEVIEILSSEMGFDYPFLARFDMIFYFPALNDVVAAEVAILQLIQTFKENGLSLTYAEPEVIYEAIERIQPIRNLGVREMRRVIEDMTQKPMLEAKRQEVEYVQLNVNDIGEVCLLNQNSMSEIKSLDQMNTSEIALLEMARQYRNFGLKLTYSEPEMIVKAAKKISPINGTDPSQISRTLFNMIKPQMVQASKANVRQVQLGLNDSGRPCLKYA